MEPPEAPHPVGIVNSCRNGHRPSGTVHALVAYITGELGDFLYSLRQEIVPTCRLRSHVSLLPPRRLAGDKVGAIMKIAGVAGRKEAFEVVLGNICVFPVTNVIYIDLSAGQDQLMAMHDDLNDGPLAYPEPFAFHPHITLGQELQPEEFATALAHCEKRWAEYTGPRSFWVEKITFVENVDNCGWSDLEDAAMAPQAVPALY